jgi:hypothetical protein
VIWVIIGVVVVVLGLALIALARSRNRKADGVATFQRQIDALSPEARRPVVDQVQQLDDEPPPESGSAEAPDGP